MITPLIIGLRRLSMSRILSPREARIIATAAIGWKMVNEVGTYDEEEEKWVNLMTVLDEYLNTLKFRIRDEL
jgi:hypothetical protein